MEAFEENLCQQDPTSLLSCSDMASLGLSMFLIADEEQSPSATSGICINKAVELTTAWIRDIYDVYVNDISQARCSD